MSRRSEHRGQGRTVLITSRHEAPTRRTRPRGWGCPPRTSQLRVRVRARMSSDSHPTQASQATPASDPVVPLASPVIRNVSATGVATPRLRGLPSDRPEVQYRQERANRAPLVGTRSSRGRSVAPSERFPPQARSQWASSHRTSLDPGGSCVRWHAKARVTAMRSSRLPRLTRPSPRGRGPLPRYPRPGCSSRPLLCVPVAETGAGALGRWRKGCGRIAAPRAGRVRDRWD
jgi:hypothetical protein